MTTFRFLSPRPAFHAHVGAVFTSPTKDGRYTLTQATTCVFAEGTITAVLDMRRGFNFDYASIPRFAQWCMPKKHNDYAYAALVHDYLYSHHDEADRLAARFGYQDARLFADDAYLVLINPKSWRRPLMYWALRWFGKTAWDQYSKEVR